MISREEKNKFSGRIQYSDTVCLRYVQVIKPLIA